jgi:membrane fusion protein (multidrug efflux system)
MSSGIGHPVRYLLTILAVLLVVGTLGAIKFKQISQLINFGKQAQKAGPPPETVGTSLAQSQVWEGTLTSVGSVTAVRGVALSNDAPGVVSQIFFESGDVVRQGQVLLQLDSNVERAQLASTQSRRELAEINATRSKALVASGAIAQSQLDNDDSLFKTSTRDVTALQAQIDRKIVRAPFSGRLGIRQVNLGQYLNPGTQITVLEAIDSVFVDFTLPQQLLADLKVGMPVRVSIEGVQSSASDGAITAIDPEVDTTTRSIKLRASVPNKQEKLRPGMFADVSVILPTQAAQVTVPATAVIHAAYGDSVYVVEDKKDDAGNPVVGLDGKHVETTRQQFVKTGDSRGDFIAILDGVTAGATVVTAGGFKLHNGASIVVNNETKATASMDPHPENR